MAVEITLTVVSNGNVQLTQTCRKGSDNPRFHPETLLVHGEQLLVDLVRQLVQLAVLEGGAIFENNVNAERLGIRTSPEV